MGPDLLVQRVQSDYDCEDWIFVMPVKLIWRLVICLRLRYLTCSLMWSLLEFSPNCNSHQGLKDCKTAFKILALNSEMSSVLNWIPWTNRTKQKNAPGNVIFIAGNSARILKRNLHRIREGEHDWAVIVGLISQSWFEMVRRFGFAQLVQLLWLL